MRGTVLEIIQQTCAELGLPVPNEAVSSKDSNNVQLVALLNAAGYELAQTFQWQFLDRLGIITTVADQDAYDLPSDFEKIINQTLWSSSLELTPVRGPMSPQVWQSIKNGSLGSPVYQSFRIQGSQLIVDPVPGDDGEIYNFEYISNGWVQAFDDPDVYRATIINDGDIPLFDKYLLIKYLKVKMWQAKGLNTTAYDTDLARIYDAITSGDKGAPVLNLSHQHYGRYITGDNVPDGNWRV
jgi:hypothetical protein